MVIAYHGGTFFLSGLRALARRKKLRLVLDCTEWYSPRQLPGGCLSPAWWDSEIATRLIKPRVGRIMVVSSYLQEYFETRSCAVLLVPPLVDLLAPKWREVRATDQGPRRLRLAYAGTPGRKDLLLNLLRGLTILRVRGEQVALNLFGPTREALVQADRQVGDCLDQLRESVVFHGEVPQEEVPSHIMKSDFTVLLRPAARFTRAGFPTKVVESMAAGVPVIANPVGDLKRYLEDEKEGILLRDESAEAVASGIRRAMAMGQSVWRAMRSAARRRAEVAFDYRQHVERIGRFVLGDEDVSR